MVELAMGIMLGLCGVGAGIALIAGIGPGIGEGQAVAAAFQFGDGFTNMITPCSGVLMAVLSVAKIPYGKWVGRVWKFILLLIALGFLLLLPTLFLDIPGF